MGFQDKVFAITGGAGGIGRSITTRLLDAGAYVAMLDPDAVAGQALFERVRNKEKVMFYPGDVADPAVLESFTYRLLRQFGKIDGLIHAVNSHKKGLLSACTYRDFLYAQQVGVAAPYYLANQLQNHFQAGGCILNIASIPKNSFFPDSESSCASTGGLLALTKALCTSFAGRVRVNAIRTGWITSSSDRQAGISRCPAGRLGQPEDVAELALFLCSEKAEFINGETIVMDGGMSQLIFYRNEQNQDASHRKENRFLQGKTEPVW